MKIALDTGPLSDGNAGRGIGVYTKFLKETLLDLSKNEHFVVDPIDVHASTTLNQYDLIHYPSFDFFKNTLHVPKNIPVIVTIHDTIPLIYPKNYPPGLRGKIALFKQKQSLKRVSAVITDSETSKKDIVRLLRFSESKTFPIYLGPTVSKISKTINVAKKLQNFKINFPYVLYIGDVNWNKNLVTLSRACENAQLHLIIVGKRAISENFNHEHIENRPLVELQSLLKNSDFVHAVGFVSDEELPVLIKEATLLCQPSYYEGFGLSVLDAMNLGTPTVCAKTQALVELYETATLFFDPYNVADVSKKLKEVFSNSTLQKELSLKGLSLAKKFSWTETAKETLNVYKNVLAKR